VCVCVFVCVCVRVCMGERESARASERERVRQIDVLSTLQAILCKCTNYNCNVLQRVAACCSVLQCVAVCCSVLQCANY